MWNQTWPEDGGSFYTNGLKVSQYWVTISRPYYSMNCNCFVRSYDEFLIGKLETVWETQVHKWEVKDSVRRPLKLTEFLRGLSKALQMNNKYNFLSGEFYRISTTLEIKS